MGKAQCPCGNVLMLKHGERARNDVHWILPDVVLTELLEGAGPGDDEGPVLIDVAEVVRRSREAAVCGRCGRITVFGGGGTPRHFRPEGSPADGG